MPNSAIINCLERSEGNIWHTLAENALNGAYFPGSLSRDCTSNEMFRHTQEMMTAWDSFYDLEPEEQCLFLLFCGESYESQ